MLWACTALAPTKRVAPTATAAAAVHRRFRRAEATPGALEIGLSIFNSILPTPTGLAGGLAPKDWRYAAVTATRPRGSVPWPAPRPSGSPAPPGTTRGTR